MRFYFIRHGQSENNALWSRTGSREGRQADPGLTDVGQRQVQVLARFLRQGGAREQPEPGFGITHLYSSLMLRAIATASIIACELGLPLVAWEDLHESGGLYLWNPATDERVGQPGANRAYFEAHYPNLVLPESLGDEGWWNRPAEAREERPGRAARVWRDLLERHGGTDDRVAVVGHGGFYNRLLVALLDIAKDIFAERYWFVLNNAAITRIDFPDEGVDLVYLNRTDFLPPELIT